MKIKIKHSVLSLHFVHFDIEFNEGIVELVGKVDGVVNAFNNKSDRYSFGYNVGECFDPETVAKRVETAIRKFYSDECCWFMCWRIKCDHEKK